MLCFPFFFKLANFSSSPPFLFTPSTANNSDKLHDANHAICYAWRNPPARAGGRTGGRPEGRLAGRPAGPAVRRAGGRTSGAGGTSVHACTCTFIYAFIHLPIPPAIHRLCRPHNSHCFRYCQNKPTVRSADWERGRQALRAEGGCGGRWRGKGTAVVIRATLVVKHGFFPGLHPFVYPGFIPSAGGRASAGRAGGSGGWTGRLGGRAGRAGGSGGRVGPGCRKR